MSFVCPPSVLHKKVQSTSQACVTAPVAFTVSDRRGLSLGAVLSHKSNSWSIGPNTQTREPLLISRSPLDLSVFLSLSRTHTRTHKAGLQAMCSHPFATTSSAEAEQTCRECVRGACAASRFGRTRGTRAIRRCTRQPTSAFEPLPTPQPHALRLTFCYCSF